MSSDLLVDLLTQLDVPQARFRELETYYEGRQPLAYLAEAARKALDNRFSALASNIPRLAVASLAERLRITGFTGVDVWDDWVRNDLDQLCMAAHRDALLYGSAFIVVWAGADGQPQVTVESPRQVQVARDPGTREITAAVKRWTTTASTVAMLYLPDRIERWVANNSGAANTAFELAETLDNPLGIVPVVEIKNVDRIMVTEPWVGFQMFGPGLSEIDDLKHLVDGLNKVLTDMLTTSEYVGRPRRWISGLDLTERPVKDEHGNPVLDPDGNPVMELVSPIPDHSDRLMVSSDPETKFGQLAAADLAGYEKSVDVLLGQIMAVSALPAHYVGITTANPASAEAMRAAEASLTARAEARQLVFGRAWEAVAKLMVAVRDGVAVDSVSVRVQWAPASTRSVAQEADAMVKLHAEGIFSRAEVLRAMGYTTDEIERINFEISSEKLNSDPTAVFYGKQTYLSDETINSFGKAA